MKHFANNSSEQPLGLGDAIQVNNLLQTEKTEADSQHLKRSHKGISFKDMSRLYTSKNNFTE